MKILAIDPGTITTAIALGEEHEIYYYEEIESSKLSKNPHKIFQLIKSLSPDLVVAPSGYGLPPIDLRRLSVEKRLSALLRASDDPGVEELRYISYFLRNIDDLPMPVVGVPGVYNIPTVPEYRLYNRIDLGTADKTLLAVLASYIHTQGDIGKLRKTNLIVIELGAFSAGVAVANGEIIDGVGGSMFPIGLISRGGLDSEVAILFKRRILKRDIFRGGIRDLCGTILIEEIYEKCPEIYSRYVDDIAKTIAILKTSIERSSGARDVKIYLSGRGASRIIIDSLRDYGLVNTEILPSHYNKQIKRVIEGSILYGLMWSGSIDRRFLIDLGILRGFRELDPSKIIL